MKEASRTIRASLSISVIASGIASVKRADRHRPTFPQNQNDGHERKDTLQILRQGNGMNIDSRKRAVRAAKRFVRLAESLPIITRPDTEMKWLETGTKLSGQVKRASLDLTRALAEMRKP